MDILNNLERLKEENRNVYNNLRLELIDKLNNELIFERDNFHDELNKKMPILFGQTFECLYYYYSPCKSFPEIFHDVESKNKQIKFSIHGIAGADGFGRHGTYDIDICIMNFENLKKCWNFSYEYCSELNANPSFNDDITDLHRYFKKYEITNLSLKKFKHEIEKFIIYLFDVRLEIDIYDANN